MKSALEFCADLGFGGGEMVTDIEARDAEHAAESQARERALREELDKLKFSMEVLHKLAKECDRLKGELAEARRLLGACESLGGPPSFERTFLAVASPAESPTFEQLVERVGPLPTTGLAGACTASAGKCNSPKVCQEAGKCIDARIREATESTGVQPHPHPLSGECIVCEPAASPDDIRERLEKVESALHALHRFSDASTKTAEGFERRLQRLEEWARRQVAEPWFDPEQQPAAPQKQAGHVFTCIPLSASHEPIVEVCNDNCVCWHCGNQRSACRGAKP